MGIGLVRRGHRFLIRKRPPGSAYEGFWEFPGGKCEPGESPAEATRRECLEEAGLAVKTDALRRVVRYQYPHAFVELYYWDCEPESPDADPAPGTGFDWVAASQLPSLRFPEANGPVLELLAKEFPDPPGVDAV